MPYKLSGLTLNRVDLVPDGSNPDAHIVLFKAKKEAHVPAPKKKAAKKPVAKKPDSRSKSKQRGDEEEEEEEDDVAKSEDDEDEDDEDEDNEDDVEKSEDDDEEDEDGDDEEEDDEEEKPRKKSKSKAKPASKKKVAKSTDEDDDAVAEDDEDDEDDDEDDAIDEKVMKALPKSAQTVLTKMQSDIKSLRKQTRSAEKIASVEKAKREKMEFIDKAKKVIPHLTGTYEEKGALIQALYSGEPIEKKTADALVKLLKTGDAAVRDMLMSETGRRRAQSDEEADAVSALREKAADIQKADPKLTKEQAFEKACQKNPDLFNQYKVEKSRNSGRRDRDIN